MADNKRWGVGREPTAGPDIWEGWFPSYEEAHAYAMRHFNWAKHWGKALYLVDGETGEKIFLVGGDR